MRKKNLSVKVAALAMSGTLAMAPMTVRAEEVAGTTETASTTVAPVEEPAASTTTPAAESSATVSGTPATATGGATTSAPTIVTVTEDQQIRELLRQTMRTKRIMWIMWWRMISRGQIFTLKRMEK